MDQSILVLQRDLSSYKDIPGTYIAIPGKPSQLEVRCWRRWNCILMNKLWSVSSNMSGIMLIQRQGSGRLIEQRCQIVSSKRKRQDQM